MSWALATRVAVVPVKIGRHRVGPGSRTVVVAEAGVNHDGSLEAALALVDAAADAGADVVKFQVFRADALATATAAAATYQRTTGHAKQREMLRRLELSDADLARIRDHCRARGIEFLATPFSPADVDRLVALGVPGLKIASTDLNNTPLLRRAAQAGLPVIVSTGAATAEEIEAAVRRFEQWGLKERLVLLHCVSGYPTPTSAANLGAIAALGRLARVPVGFSDHTTSLAIAGWAVAAGACLLEKHFTLDRTRTGPDHAMSLEPADLSAYVAAAREAEVALGTGRLGMTPLEREVRAVARKSIVSACRIAAGTRVTPEMLTIKRPGGGVPPDEFDAVVGRRAERDIPEDTVIEWGMLA